LGNRILRRSRRKWVGNSKMNQIKHFIKVDWTKVAQVELRYVTQNILILMPCDVDRTWEQVV